MEQRGVTESEVARTLAEGAVVPVRTGRQARVKVFADGYNREGGFFPHKEVWVAYKEEADDTIVVTVIVRYGRWEQER
jgi:hypothetical protein